MKLGPSPHPRTAMALRHAAILLLALAPLFTAAAGDAGTGMVSYRVVGDGIPSSLTGVTGDPRRGRSAAANASQGNCAICHRLPIAELPVFGDIGPPLDGVGGRLGEAQLRLRLVDPRRLHRASIMPAYYRVEGLHRVAPRYRGQPLLGAQDIEDIVAYLMTLR
ncbi:MAG TPA: sulfur oxidation c-type cytochrome SoxX [Ramlibacter sp.]|nr:sulfur oxidation c-type cytochrome SoxX [Ramlibacter sp.]